MPLYQHPLLLQGAAGELRFGGARMAFMDIGAGFWGLRRQVETLVGSRMADSVLHQAGANGGASFARTREGVAEEGAAGFLDCVAALEAAGFGHFQVREIDWPAGRVTVVAADAAEAWMMRRNGRVPDGPACAFAAGVLAGLAAVTANRGDLVCVERECAALGAPCCRFEVLPAGEDGAATPVAFDPDPYLSRQLNLLEVLFDRSPASIALWDRDLVLRRCNPTFVSMVERYTPARPGRAVPGARLFRLLPGTEGQLLPLWERALAGETVQENSLRIECGGRVSYRDLVLAPIVENGAVVGVLDVAADVTEKVLAYHELEARVQERTREVKRRQEAAEGLRQVMAVLNSSRPLPEILTVITDEARRLLGPESAEILLVGSDPGRFADPLVRQALATRQPAVQPERLAVPLLEREESAGVLVLDFGAPHPATPDEVKLAVALADQAALAVENERLRERTERTAAAAERSRLARDLHDAVTQTLFSASLIAEVMPRLWEKDEVEGRRRLDELRRLTRGALAEMRTLLLELRPAALVEADLCDLLPQLAEAVSGRARMPVTCTAEGRTPLPPDVQVGLYRIAQEALNNAAKHAAASAIIVSYEGRPGAVSLTIADDGVGFDATLERPGHLGLGIMRERAAAVGAGLSVASSPGAGTRITVRWPAARGEEVVRE